MAFIEYNANPAGRRVGDCTVRAISKALGKDWDDVYTGLFVEGYSKSDMPSANSVWGAYLRDHGFTRRIIPDDLMDYTVRDFCADHPTGTYILAIDGHVVCVIDGDYYDAWDSGNEIPHYYWFRKDDE